MRLEHVLFCGIFALEPAEEFGITLGKIVRPLRHFFSRNDGSTAVEVAAQLAVSILGGIGGARDSKSSRARERLPRRHARRDVCE